MRLRHYRAEPFDFDSERIYTQYEPYIARKPSGLWVSVEGEDDWPWWCKDNEFREHALKHVYEVQVDPAAKLCHIDNVKDLQEFHDFFAVETEFDHRSRGWASERFLRNNRPVDWRAVAGEYDGLIIAPYQWQLRLDLMWYYGWDCASGCIWSPQFLTVKEAVDERV